MQPTEQEHREALSRRWGTGPEPEKSITITPTLKEMESIGFVRVNVLGKDSDKIIIRNRSVTFIAHESHDPYGKKNGKWHWAGYQGSVFVSFWSARSLPDAINTLIEEERRAAYHEGRQAMQQEFKDLLGLK